MSRPISIVEVGPRDGLQNETTILDPAVRADLVNRLEAAGARRIEAVSFVHPKYVPRPLAALAISPAVAGATTTRSAQRDSSIWPIAVSSSGRNSF